MLLSHLVSLLPFSLLVMCQQIFIDRVPGYSELPACAETPVSYIVRNMASGCGDGGQATSYSCFCSASSTRFDAIISTAVASRCRGETSGVAQASSVFNSYCRGINVTPTATATMAAQTNSTAVESCGWTPVETAVTVQSAVTNSAAGLRSHSLFGVGLGAFAVLIRLLVT